MQTSLPFNLRTFLSPQKILLCSFVVAPTPRPSQRQTPICFNYRFLYFLEISYVWNHTICGLLCLVSLMYHVFEVCLCSFLLWNSISLYGYTTLFIHPLVGTQTVSSFWLLWIMLSLISTCKSLCKHEHVIFSCVDTAELLNDVVNLLNFLRSCQIVLQSGCTISHSH